MADVKSFPAGINKRILRDGTSWQNSVKFIEDETMSGKRKRRLSATQEKKSFSVKMRFTENEYQIFDQWFTDTLKSGLYSFYFPQIDRSVDKPYRIYRFTKDGSPQYSNPGGKLFDVSMKWEEM